MNDDFLRQQRRARQRFTVLTLAAILIAGGLVVLFALQRVPLPMRIFAGLGDIVAGCVLLVLARQKFRPDRTVEDR
jgi:hypothetical protein